MNKDACDHGLKFYYDLVWDNVTKPVNKINQQSFQLAISELEMILINHVERIGITEYALRVQELLCQLRIILFDAQGKPTKHELEILEYVLMINFGISLFNEHFKILDKEIQL